MPKNVENFEIRTLGRDDYAQAAEIFAFVHALHQANRPDIYRKTNVPLGEDEFFKMCDDPHEIMLCAVRDGKILGLARTVMRGNTGDAVTLPHVRAVMEELAVLPQAQGMGIGTALLGSLLSWVGSFMMIGFGDLVENTAEIAANTRKSAY